MKESFSLYIHIPFCLSKCDYCDFYSVPTDKCSSKSIISEEYVNSLCNEINYRIKNYKTNLCKSVYIGGGTPSLLSENQIKKITETIFSSINETEDFEFSFEVNPDDVTKDLLETLNFAGINRISCGIQSLNDKSLKSVNRRAGRKENIQALDMFKKYWKNKLSLDLICGLPEESELSFIEGINVLTQYSPNHISMYSLTIEEETPLGQLVELGKLDYDFNFSDELWLKGKEILEKNHYLQYEVSNFCKENQECKHNLTYWQHEDYLGCGSGATGTIYNLDGTGIRWTNTTDLKNYIDFWDLENPYKEKEIPQNLEIIDLDSSIFEYFMMGMRKLSGISQKDFFSKFQLSIPDKILKVLEEWNKNQLLEILSEKNDKIYRMNKNGILFLNKFLEEI